MEDIWYDAPVGHFDTRRYPNVKDSANSNVMLGLRSSWENMAVIQLLSSNSLHASEFKSILCESCFCAVSSERGLSVRLHPVE